MSKTKKRARLYSALEVANICGVVNQTAINWIRRGGIKAFVTPGGQYRIYASDLAEFLIKNNMRLPDELSEEIQKSQSFAVREKNSQQKLQIVLVTKNEQMEMVVKAYASERSQRCDLYCLSSMKEAMKALSVYSPDYILIDSSLPVTEEVISMMEEHVEQMRGMKKLGDCQLILLNDIESATSVIDRRTSQLAA